MPAWPSARRWRWPRAWWSWRRRGPARPLAAGTNATPTSFSLNGVACTGSTSPGTPTTNPTTAAPPTTRPAGWGGLDVLDQWGTWTNGGYTLYNKHLGQRRGQPDDLGELVQPLGRDGQPTRTPGVCRASSTSRCCT
ncbi:hypothetical protein ACFQ1L_35670 [Phytohabitans flavus]|uniref:hypothetical protein n=1 Tax=Phytohabitans flavus TaxID=1076124 RepID=UPI00363D7387